MPIHSKIISASLLGLFIAGCGGGGSDTSASSGGGNVASDNIPFLGIHMHLSGTSPLLLESATLFLKASQAQCKSFKEICALAPVGTNDAVCKTLPNEYQFKGNLADAGKDEVDEYFATGERMRTTRTRVNAFFITSTCGSEVKEVESVKIRQFTATGWTDYERKEDRNKARYWQRTDREMLPDAVMAQLASLAPVTGASVSPPSGKDSVANNPCDIHSISGPMVGTICITKTDTPYPGILTLAVTLGGANSPVVLNRRATVVTKNTQLNRADFYPPADEPVKLL